MSTTQFVSQGLSIYVDTARRDNLQQQGRFAVERVSRELRNALPGSVRVAGNCVDFMPVLNASSYLQSVVTEAAISSLDIIDVGYSLVPAGSTTAGTGNHKVIDACFGS